ncbi:MarR family transcriptional regulator [Flavobacterium sp. NST-5]|uniref:MarR family transcriptional regulator n=1 Tax=Flavobacterium ichthyis TaxID=2698827 RepID=A0ABW9Z6D3_9FLAO|nr:helix-turn-helix domain-containing protein [Flavobacterium ichthyis]NBL64214.1 MarR family transcriptional regulator [Flavobacterium ichthyis]
MFTIDDKNFPCSTSVTMRFIGGKWKAVILIHLAKKTQRYSELRKMIPTITERTLSLQLKQLEEDGLILRQVFTEKPPLTVDYSLTDFGKSLIPVLKSIAEWGILAQTHSNKIKELRSS